MPHGKHIRKNICGNISTKNNDFWLNQYKSFLKKPLFTVISAVYREGAFLPIFLHQVDLSVDLPTW